ncbi:MAG: 6-hydroxymethylpterin diphosphokinase MptE-like protein [Nitrososphaerales archaeon]
MELKDWYPWYNKIASAFNFNSYEDQRAADILSELIQNNYIEPCVIKSFIQNKPVLVFGAGPSLEEDVNRIENVGLFDKSITIAADGATSALLEIVNKAPNIIVTDLDGRFEDLLSANKKGSLMVVHAHGDNIPQILNYVPKLTKILGTTQVEPRPRVYNFGGFTDGDRAVFLAVEMGAKMISLVGMDLGRIIGKYSKQYVKSKKRKLLKLKFCKKLLEWLALRTKINLYNLTSHGERINGFKEVTPEYIAKIS